jgi:hypothetical protein
VRPVDLQRVEQAAYGGGEVTERVGVVHVLAGPAVAGQVRHHHPEAPSEHVDVAGVVGQSRRSRTAAMQQQHGITGALLADRDVAGTDPDEPLLRDLLLDAHWISLAFFIAVAIATVVVTATVSC